jgi:hypothetical protein
MLAQARAGTLPGMVRTGATFAMAAEGWLRFVETDRQRKRSTVRGYRSIVRSRLLPAFGDRPLEQINAREIERWRSDLAAERRLANASINRFLIALHGIFERARRVWGLKENPLRDVDRQPARPRVDTPRRRPRTVAPDAKPPGVTSSTRSARPARPPASRA